MFEIEKKSYVIYSSNWLKAKTTAKTIEEYIDVKPIDVEELRKET